MTKIQKDNKNLAKFPNLRFPGFEGEWETRKLGEVCEINPKNGNLPQSFIYIDLESVENGRLMKEDVISIDEAPSRAQRILLRNDVLFQMVRPYQKNNLFFDKEGKYVASTGYAQIRTKQNSQFIFQYLHNQKFVDRVIERCTGTSYPAINSADLGNIRIDYPSLEEQEKISTFLSLVDKRIQTQNKIIEGLKKLKVATAKKIFSQEFRFKDNNGNDFSKWEEMKLKNIVIIQMGQSPDSSSYNFENIGIPLIQGNADILNRKSNPRQYTSKPTKFCDVGDLLLTVRAPVGYVGKSKHYACIGRGICSVKNNDKSILEFIYQFLLYFEDKWKSIEQGSTFTAVNSSDINSINILLPSIPEQAKIANFLSAIDSKIDMENQLLQKLEEQKKFLLQNMFV